MSFIDELDPKTRQDYEEFLKYQQTAVATLKALAEVCDKNNIRYYVTYGSLIGLIRHGGQIPWDYDIDVWVPMCESQKLMDALDKELQGRYHYTTRLKDKKCRTFTLKLAPIEYDPEVLHVDVFWVGKAPDDPSKCSKMGELGFKYYYLMMRKYGDARYLDHKGTINKLKYAIKRLPAKLTSAKKIDREWMELVGNDFDGADQISDSFYVFPKEQLEPAADFTAEDGFTYKIPADSDSILRGYYGDYMQLPDRESQIKEFEKALARLKSKARL